jgi:hypothetical protein
MKMICAQAKTTAKRGKRIDAVIKKYSELWRQSMGEWMLQGSNDKQPKPAGVTRSYINWGEKDDQTIIELEMRDDSNVERLASEMRACGCVVKVMTEEEYLKQEGLL